MTDLCRRASAIAGVIARVHELGHKRDIKRLQWLRDECLRRESNFERDAILSVINTYLKPDMQRPDWVLRDGLTCSEDIEDESVM